jgi:hypothetical protein
VARDRLRAGIAHKRGKDRVGSREASFAAARDGFLAVEPPPHDAEIMFYRQVAASMWQRAEVLAFRDSSHAIAHAFGALFLVIPLIPAKRAGAKS